LPLHRRDESGWLARSVPMERKGRVVHGHRIRRDWQRWNGVAAFRPTALGTRLGALMVSGSDGIASASPSVALSGVGADFSITATPSSANVKHGQSVTFRANVGSVGGAFNSPVALSCTGLPSKSSCSFSPASLTPGANGATSVMTVLTSGNTPRGKGRC
jgi:hypothetical protein